MNERTHIVDRIVRRVISEAFDASDLSATARDAYVASSDRIDEQLTKLSIVIEDLARSVNSPITAAKIVNAIVSELTYATRRPGPTDMTFSMSRSARAVAEQHPNAVAEAYDRVDDILATLNTIISNSPVPPVGVESTTTTIVHAYIDDYLWSHGG